MAHTDLTVAGMTCQACVTRVTRQLEKVDGVSGVSIRLATGRVRVTSDRPLSRPELAAAVRAAGYRVGRRSPWLASDPAVWRDVSLAVVGVVLVVFLLRTPAVTDAMARVGTGALTGGAVMVALLGLVAGFSTCMAMVGGLVLAISARHAEALERSGVSLTPCRRLAPQLAFNAGRIVGFAVLGAGLGALGTFLTLSGPVLAVTMIVVAVVMGLVGVRLTGVSPRLAALTLTLPGGLGARVGGVSRASTGWGAALAGAATFLLPCGFTQAVQVLALASGDPVRAAVTMAAFALGTAPGLLAVGSAASLATGRAAASVFRVAGVAVVAFALVNGAGGLRLLGVGSAGSGDTGTTLAASEVSDVADLARAVVSENVELTDGVQVISTNAGMVGYEPEHTTILAGVPVRWEIALTGVSCTSYLWAPFAGVDPPMPLAAEGTVIEFEPGPPGEYELTCGMGMFQAWITVVADPRA